MESGPWDWDLGLPSEGGIWTSRLEFGPWVWDLGLEGGIWASRLRFGPQGWDMGLQAEIWAWRLGERGEWRRRRRRRRRKFPICVKAQTGRSKFFSGQTNVV